MLVKRVLVGLTFLVGCCAVILGQPVRAQPATVAALLAATDQLQKALSGVITTLSVEAQKTIGATITQLQGLEGQVKHDVADLEVPIQNVGANAQNSVNTLTYLVDNLNQLMTQQRGCADLDINLFLASLQTTVAQAKRGIPFVQSGSPALNEFVFTGHAPNVVPLTGGPVKLSGFKLWQDRQPIVTLVRDPGSEDPLVTLTASRQSDNAVLVDVPTAVLQVHAGQCIYLNVRTRHPAFLGLGTADGESAAMPFCVPDVALTEYQMDTVISYSCSGQSNTTVTATAQIQHNTDCGGPHGVSGVFAMPVPPNCRVIGAESVKGGLTRRETGSTSASYSGPTVTLTGTLDQADCVNVWPVSHMNSDSVWDYSAKATLSCDTNTPNSTEVRSPWTAASQPETNIATDTNKKQCTPSGNTSDATIKVFRVIRSGSSAQAAASAGALGTVLSQNQGILSGSQPSAPQIGTQIYDKSGSQPGGGTLHLGAASFGSTTTDSEYTPGSADNPAHATASIRSNACGY